MAHAASAGDLDTCWVDGKVAAPCPPDIAARIVSALETGRACYTTALFRGGAGVWAERHAERLARDAAALGFGPVDTGSALLALAELGAAAFGEHEGIVRVAALEDGPRASRIVAECRAIGTDPDLWSAEIAPLAHQAAGRWTGAKGSNFGLYVRARAHMEARGLEEVLLVDAEGFVIEGCRSNLFLVDANGTLVAPNITRGAVAGLAQEIVHERHEDVVTRDFPVEELPSARELIAVNAVRHARAIVRIDGRDVGDGREGPWCRLLRETLGELK